MEESEWDTDMELHLHNICLKCVIFSQIHEDTAKMYNSYFNYFSLGLIFVSFVASLVSIIPINHTSFNFINSIFAILTSSLATTNKFLQWHELATKHRIGSQEFLKLNENISLQLLTDRKNRPKPIEYLNTTSSMFLKIRATLPYPSNSINKSLNVDHTVLDQENGTGTFNINNKSTGGDIESGFLKTNVSKFQT